jgi:hypothetical protein
MTHHCFPTVHEATRPIRVAPDSQKKLSRREGDRQCVNHNETELIRR